MENGYSSMGLLVRRIGGLLGAGSGFGFGFGFASACGVGDRLPVDVFTDDCFAAGAVAETDAFVCAEAAVLIMMSDNSAMNDFFIKYSNNCYCLLITFSATGCILFCGFSACSIFV